MLKVVVLVSLVVPTVVALTQSTSDPAATEVWKAVPVVRAAEGAPPSDATVLFDGADLSEWEGAWRVEDGAVTVVPGSGDLVSKRSFGDVQLHLEWRAPETIDGEGQGRGNSGVFLMGRYEVQVLDSFENETYANGQAASIYKQHIPLVNASREPGEWQSYDIIFRAPAFAEDGTVSRPAVMTVLHNGVLVQDHAPLEGPTVFIGSPVYEAHEDALPLMLQDHQNPVSFRNIWVREL